MKIFIILALCTMIFCTIEIKGKNDKRLLQQGKLNQIQKRDKGISQLQDTTQNTYYDKRKGYDIQNQGQKAKFNKKKSSNMNQGLNGNIQRNQLYQLNDRNQIKGLDQNNINKLNQNNQDITWNNGNANHNNYGKELNLNEVLNQNNGDSTFFNDFNGNRYANNGMNYHNQNRNQRKNRNQDLRNYKHLLTQKRKMVDNNQLNGNNLIDKIFNGNQQQRMNQQNMNSNSRLKNDSIQNGNKMIRQKKQKIQRNKSENNNYNFDLMKSKNVYDPYIKI